MIYRRDDQDIDGWNAPTVIDVARLRGGRPSGTTKKRKQFTSLAMRATKNEITHKYKRDLSRMSANKRAKKDALAVSSTRSR